MQMPGTLLDALSPNVLSLVEASLGRPILTNERIRRRAQDDTIHRNLTKSDELSQATLDNSDKKSNFGDYILNPSEVFVLRRPESPGFITRKNFLGKVNAERVLVACHTLKESGKLRDAGVGHGDKYARIQDIRGDQIMWLPRELEKLNPDIQLLLRKVEKLAQSIPFMLLS